MILINHNQVLAKSLISSGMYTPYTVIFIPICGHRLQNNITIMLRLYDVIYVGFQSELHTLRLLFGDIQHLEFGPRLLVCQDAGAVFHFKAILFPLAERIVLERRRIGSWAGTMSCLQDIGSSNSNFFPCCIPKFVAGAQWVLLEYSYDCRFSGAPCVVTCS